MRRFWIGLVIASFLLPLGWVPPAGARAEGRSMAGSEEYAEVILADEPMSYWRLGEETGTVAHDASGNGRDATYVGEPHLGRRGAIVSDPDTAVGFDGIDDYAVWAPRSIYRGAYSVEAWVRTIIADRSQTFFSTRGMCPGTCRDYSFDIKLENFYGHGIRVDVGTGAYWLVTETFSFPWRAGIYYHIVAVASTTGLAVFVDGDLIGQSPYADTPFLGGPERVAQIGVSNATGGVEWFKGLIDEVAVYGYPLTADQVAEHHTAGTSP
jgi:hypothetical protein